MELRASPGPYGSGGPGGRPGGRAVQDNPSTARGDHTFLTNSDFRLMAPRPSILQSMS